ncbi:phycobilisome rod-core linker polypeptide [Synechococcus sp. CCY 9618]|uniref:phycobilisome rod-core linker polypeptide n=1 Tax=Synechococcus sp. CCY 9618 TaxID=2815602 RepID=UPI001C22BD22|nr:phycobilisome rod-core linker polypeptide [Synechococcus sp. CCY 9618]
MALPLLDSPPLSINARVRNFAVPSEESPRQVVSGLDSTLESVDRPGLDARIEQAYRQIFFHAFKIDREVVLESQLRRGQITMRDFVRGLLLSRRFREGFYECNSNYRMVEQLVGRVLGRPVYGEQERIASSILIAQHGLAALVDTLLDSSEYLDAFGYDTVPYQRSRVLPGRALGALPFNQQAPRYDARWRDVSASRTPRGGSAPWVPGTPRPAWLGDQPSPLARQVWQGLVTTGGFVLTGFVLWTAAAMLSTGWGG